MVYLHVMGLVFNMHLFWFSDEVGSPVIYRRV